MSETLSLSDARGQLGRLVRRARSRDRVTITDHGEPSAVIIGAEELADLEEQLALAQRDARVAAGRSGPSVPHAEVKARLGLE